MRWTLISIAAAIALIMLGFYVVGPDNMDVAQKTVYWFCVVAFLSAQALHFASWVRKHDL